MVELLSPLAARNGLRRGDGAALWKRLTELAGIDPTRPSTRLPRTTCWDG